MLVSSDSSPRFKRRLHFGHFNPSERRLVAKENNRNLTEAKYYWTKNYPFPDNILFKSIEIKMSDNQHDLVSDFPEHKELIHQLKSSNHHFRNLFEQHHELNKAIHRAEQRVDTISELEEEKLRKDRLRIKDELFEILSQSKKA
jgi:uncharacterized protein YdcH (DUF465 family)